MAMAVLEKRQEPVISPNFYVRQVKNFHDDFGGTTAVLTFDRPTLKDSLLVLFVRQGSNSSYTSTVADDQGQAWTQTAAGYRSSSAANRMTAYYLGGSVGNVLSITVSFFNGATPQSVAPRSIVGYEIVGGARRFAEIAAIAGDNANTPVTSIATEALKTSAPDVILLAAAGFSAGTSGWKPGPGWTMDPNASIARIASEHRIVSSLQAGRAAMSWTSSAGCTTWLLAFRAEPTLSVGRSRQYVATGASGGGADTTLAAALSGTASLAAALTTQIQMAAGLNGSGTLVGSLQTDIRLAAALQGLGSLTAALTTQIQMAAVLAGYGTLAADLDAGNGSLSAVLAGTAQLAAALSTQITLAAQLAGYGAVAAALTTEIRLAAQLATSGTLAGALQTDTSLAAALAGSASLQAALTTAIELQALLHGSGSLTADLLVAQVIEALNRIAVTLHVAPEIPCELQVAAQIRREIET